MLGTDSWLIITVPLAVVLLVAAGLTRRLAWGRAVGLGVLVLYGLAVISLTHFPMPASMAVIEADRSFGDLYLSRHNLVPLATVRDAASVGTFRYQVGGNLVMLAPLGFLVPLLWPKRASFWLVVRLGLVTIMAIELSQLAITTALRVRYKSFDVDDILLNLIGVCGGWAAWWLTDRLLSSRAWWVDLRGWLRSPRPAARDRTAPG